MTCFLTNFMSPTKDHCNTCIIDIMSSSSGSSSSTTTTSTKTAVCDLHDDFSALIQADVKEDLEQQQFTFQRLEWSLRTLRAEFKLKNTEYYFKRYQTRLCYRWFTIVLIFNIIVCLTDAIWYYINQEDDNSSPCPIVIRISALLVYLCFLIVTTNHDERWLNNSAFQFLAALLIFLTMVYTEYGTFIIFHFSANSNSTINHRNLRQSLSSWKRARPIFYIIFCNEILLPFSRRLYSTSCSTVVVVLEIVITLWWPRAPSDQNSCPMLTPSWQYFHNWSQLIRQRGFYFLSDMLFYVLAGLVAFYVTYLLEIVNRRAFLDHRKCVESKFKLTFEKDEQERLLASCLPRHLMKKVRDDIRSRFTGHWSTDHLRLVPSASNHSNIVPVVTNGSQVVVIDNNNNKHQHHLQPVTANHHKSRFNSSIGRPFSEMYIDKYQNVTILYADIVNSMALTQSLQSPKALVETLNNLFCRFDSRAESYDCLRIKILGDCYYCISGIPDQDLRHAVNCLDMGLDMIDIIKKFRLETGINVDMRIGIHTGMILSGLLGLKKWQFDIWSIDTMKASQMEQEGRPGYVHITSTTLQQIPSSTLDKLSITENHVLDNETTYLIQRRTWITENNNDVESSSLSKTPTISKQQQNSPSLNQQVSIVSEEDATNSNDGDADEHWNSFKQKSQSKSSRRRPMLEVVNSLRNYGEMIRCSNDSLSQTIDKMSINLKRQYNIKNSLLEINPIFLYFIHLPSGPSSSSAENIDSSSNAENCKGKVCRNHCIYCKSDSSPSSSYGLLSIWYHLKRIHRINLKRERKYLQQADHLFPYYLISSFVISLMIILIRFLALYDHDYIKNNQWKFFLYENGNMLCYLAILVSIIALVWILCYKRGQHPVGIWFRMAIWLVIPTLLVTSTIMDMAHCSLSQTQELRIEKQDNSTGKECLYKWSRYYTYSSILAISSISLFIRINLWFKFTLSTIALMSIAITNYHHPCSIFIRIDRFYQMDLGEKEVDFFTPTMSHLHYLFIVYLMFHILDRQIEYISRLDFLWACKLKRERREARLMREVNQLLLKNILPIHVAQKFLTNPEQANSLYYEPYDSCAVMFAAIPNFFKFYTENKENDDGLQYLYLLNDIICEFDKLLILPQFKRRIEKIKTIGSTYMAASGLQPGRASIDSSITTKQEVNNLVIMIRFAMSMIRVLNHLNSIPQQRDEQTKSSSHASIIHHHFKLRVGISMGPVIAGVVGAVKPQYDIWGDTVNVASRMDTYGVVNKIQIPHYVAKVLLDNQLFRPYSRGVQEIKGKGQLETYLIDYDEQECLV